ncbi:MAG: PKD domain-containing protein [Candidatus Eisenbacteria bacterium]|uniref:PKD domain-containing protein n=1 Tax=Eiseniibacteriota bacterium TaxID=2212470 RepID=A0A538T906_UNCEI|nr:MAG: PKD domain-containing protein [Candidatus Eisenbacteria bacterium]
MKRVSACAAALLVLAVSMAPTGIASNARSTPNGRTPQRAPRIIDNATRMDANNLDMVVTNHGSFAFDLTTGAAGLVYPKGSTNTVLFAAGPWIGARVGGNVRVAVGEYSQEFVPGPMRNGTFLPDQPSFRNFKIFRGNTTSFDYLNWPVQDGAPVDGAGRPALLGDVMTWCVYNDADSAVHSNNAGMTQPLGIEVQQSTFAFDRAGPLGNTIFVKLKFTNRGSDRLDDTYLTLWSDPDLGGFADDLVGCDTLRGLGYCYNATNADQQYGSSPPAVGFDLLRGPIVQHSPGVFDTLGMTGFNKFINGTDPMTATESYNYMQGLNPDGSPIHVNDDPFAPITTFQVSGDPVAGSGWLDTNPADRRIMISSGPFTMAPGDSQEVVLAIIVGQGTDRLASITQLKFFDDFVQSAFDAGLLRSGPEIHAPAATTVDEGQGLEFQVTASDPAGAAVALSASDLPVGATFLDTGNGIGVFRWTPGFDQAGVYSVGFTATDSIGSSAATTVITVRNVNRKPVARAGGPYSGFVGVPVRLDGGASSDPDGDLLAFSWFFGDGETGSGPAPEHAYGQKGVYGVALTVSDGALDDIATTSATIAEIFSARAFTSGGNHSIRLTAGKPQWCVQIEPIGRSYENSMVDPADIIMKSSGTGSVDRIHALSGKTVIGSDRDGNGIEEITACFSKEDLRLLFGNLRGRTSVPVELEGGVLTGGRFRAALDVGIVAAGGALAASVSPNPLNPSATLSFVTPEAGPVRVSLFDISGRRVRTLLEVSDAYAGFHSVGIDGRDQGGRELRSGIYFYRIETRAAVTAGRLAVLR